MQHVHQIVFKNKKNKNVKQMLHVHCGVPRPHIQPAPQPPIPRPTGAGQRAKQTKNIQLDGVRLKKE